MSFVLIEYEYMFCYKRKMLWTSMFDHYAAQASFPYIPHTDQSLNGTSKSRKALCRVSVLLNLPKLRQI